jgi:CubicO group peptidase (beta-lactamase class C family)
MLLLITLWATGTKGQAPPTSAEIDTYLRPYVASRNFAGIVLVEKSGKVMFDQAYGYADRERRVRNSPGTRFHIASMSMQFTAAAVLRLVDTGSVSLDEHVSDFVPDLEGGDKITIRDLLEERSGLPDINSLPNYDSEVLQRHQTPSSLVAQIEGKPLLFAPGSQFLHEEHSAYNLLALIVEEKTGLPFASAVEQLVFAPLGLASSGVDDDSARNVGPVAKGYEPEDTNALRPAAAIHWSGKTGNASVYTTAGDEVRWVDLLFGGHFLSMRSREAMLDPSMTVGYGWFKGENKRFGETAYYMNGRAPGFGSFLLYLPHEQLTVIVLSNIRSSATTPIGYDIAALSVGLSYQPLHFAGRALTRKQRKSSAGTFQFGPDFYQPNAKVAVIENGGGLSLRWPGGSLSALLPLDRDRFVDRSYWQQVKIERDRSGKPTALLYDRFRGPAIPEP